LFYRLGGIFQQPEQILCLHTPPKPPIGPHRPLEPARQVATLGLSARPTVRSSAGTPA
jgi:hypothetical protein